MSIRPPESAFPVTGSPNPKGKRTPEESVKIDVSQYALLLQVFSASMGKVASHYAASAEFPAWYDVGLEFFNDPRTLDAARHLEYLDLITVNECDGEADFLARLTPSGMLFVMAQTLHPFVDGRKFDEASPLTEAIVYHLANNDAGTVLRAIGTAAVGHDGHASALIPLNPQPDADSPEQPANG